jgi:hypothetical protein
MRISLCIPVLFAFLVLQACQKSNPELLSFFDPLKGRGPYATAFFDNTQEKTLNSNFDTVLQANMTFWNSQLREAYLEEMAKSYRMQDEELNALLMEQMAEDESYFVFIMTAHTRDPKLNDFHRAKSSWRLVLEDPTGKLSVRAESVERISEKNNPNAPFFQSMSRFGQTYRIRFPKHPLANEQKLKLFITGPHGSLPFEFKTDRLMSGSRLLEIQ